MTQRSPAALALAEADVQRLCGAATFRRAAALQQAGHVLSPTIAAPGAATPGPGGQSGQSGQVAAAGLRLAARVRGTWRRLDDVEVAVQAGKLQARCTCRLGAAGE